MNIDGMQAGREMDALVAEKVMGWTEVVMFGAPGISLFFTLMMCEAAIAITDIARLSRALTASNAKPSLAAQPGDVFLSPVYYGLFVERRRLHNVYGQGAEGICHSAYTSLPPFVVDIPSADRFCYS